MTTALITHADFLAHVTPAHVEEQPARLAYVLRALEGLPLERYEAPLAEVASILALHDAAYLARIKASIPDEGFVLLDADTDSETALSPTSWPAILHAVGAAQLGVDLVMSGAARNAFAAIRPPGHHAKHALAMGFCFLNNIGVTLAYALEKYNLGKVAIIDFDVHHGNGTAEMFANDSRVLMCSFYQNLIFPNVHTEKKSENMLNIPVEAYATGEVVRKLISDHWLPRLQAFEPEFIFVSAGFDAHREDELAQLGLVENDYAWITEQIVAQAEASAQGRVVSFLEGGYNLSALGRSAVAHVKALAKL